MKLRKQNKSSGFETLVTCENPMEVELFPASMREHDIPHRTEWMPAGQLIVKVPLEWHGRALEILNEASRVFFGHDLGNRELTTRRLPVEFSELSPNSTDTGVPPGPQIQEVPEQLDEDDEDDGFAASFFDDAGVVTPDEIRIRPVWPATLLSLLPGAGLGHLYAGRFQIFFYLIFCSLVGALFFRYTGSYWALLLIGFSWLMDLLFATTHVRTHNEQAQRALKRSRQAEADFLHSLEPGGQPNDEQKR